MVENSLLTLDTADKLPVFLVKKLVSNMVEYGCSARGETDKRIRKYNHILETSLKCLNDYSKSNALICLLYKLVFKNLNILRELYKRNLSYRKEGNLHKLIASYSKNLQEIEKYVRMIKINLVTYYKTLLKELDLMKFYEQCLEMNRIRIDEDFYKEGSVRKVKKIDELLRYLYLTVLRDDTNILSLYDAKNYFNKNYRLLYLIIYYVSFHYRLKITNYLLRQYEKVINDDQLKQKINVRLYKHLSLTLIFIFLSEAVFIAIKLVEENDDLVLQIFESADIGSIENLVNKLNKTLTKIYSVLFNNEKEDNRTFLIFTSNEYPYIDGNTNYLIRYQFAMCTKKVCEKLSSLVQKQLNNNFNSTEFSGKLYSILQTINQIYFITDKLWLRIDKLITY